MGRALVLEADLAVIVDEDERGREVWHTVPTGTVEPILRTIKEFGELWAEIAVPGFDLTTEVPIRPGVARVTADAMSNFLDRDRIHGGEVVVDDDLDADGDEDWDASICRFEPNEDLPARLRRIVDAIVNDPRFDSAAAPRSSNQLAADDLAQHLAIQQMAVTNSGPDRLPGTVMDDLARRSAVAAALAEHCAELNALDYVRVREAARGKWGPISARLESEARRLAPEVVRQGWFDPLEQFGRLSDQLDRHMGISDPRLRQRVVWRVWGSHGGAGLHERAMNEMIDITARLVDQLCWADRDELGLAKGAQRERLVSSILKDQPARVQRFGSRHIVQHEKSTYRRDREARYATAARRLLDRGGTKAGTARTLGISASILTRLLRDYPQDVVLSSDDPLIRRLT